jgi:hypothetical protein
MRATTIKVEGELLAELNKAKPANVTLTAFVRSILEREVMSTKLDVAADRYAAFLETSPDEREWLRRWTSADLATPPKRRRVK